MEIEPNADGKIAEKAWFLIKETVGVGDFVGTEGLPVPMSDTDVAKILSEVEKTTEQATANIKVDFAKGDVVKIREGAFENFEGAVDSIDAERGVVRVIVTIFGRSTPLDIEYWQIEKV
jgi:transcriptional antiterminator NusG